MPPVVLNRYFLSRRENMEGVVHRKGKRERAKEDFREGEFKQISICACIEMSQRNPLMY